MKELRWFIWGGSSTAIIAGQSSFAFDVARVSVVGEREALMQMQSDMSEPFLPIHKITDIPAGDTCVLTSVAGNLEIKNTGDCLLSLHSICFTGNGIYFDTGMAPNPSIVLKSSLLCTIPDPEPTIVEKQ